MSHLFGCLSLWYAVTSEMRVQVYHIQNCYLKFFTFSWHLCTCFLRFVCVPAETLHNSHSQFETLRWTRTLIMCMLRFDWQLKARPHTSHLYIVITVSNMFWGTLCIPLSDPFSCTSWHANFTLYLMLFWQLSKKQLTFRCRSQK